MAGAASVIPMTSGRRDGSRTTKNLNEDGYDAVGHSKQVQHVGGRTYTILHRAEAKPSHQTLTSRLLDIFDEECRENKPDQLEGHADVLLSPPPSDKRQRTSHFSKSECRVKRMLPHQPQRTHKPEHFPTTFANTFLLIFVVTAGSCDFLYSIPLCE